MDKLEDKFEGTASAQNYQFRLARERLVRHQMTMSPSYNVSNRTDPNNQESIIQSVEEQYKHDLQMKSITCIDCWNYFSGESAALWKIYSDFGKGLMIKSNLTNVETSFENSIEEIRISEITYIDYKNELMPDYNSFYLAAHKDIAYSYENEVRLIHNVSLGNVGWQHDWSKEEVEEGVYIKMDVDILIDELIVAPHAPKWYIDLIKNLCAKYNLDKPVNRSRLS